MMALVLGEQGMHGRNKTSKAYDDWLEGRLLIFHGNNRDDFRPRELCVKAVLQGKNIINWISDKDFDRKNSERALAVILSSLAGNPLRPI